MIELQLYRTFSMNVKTSIKRNFYHGRYKDINKFLSSVEWIAVFNSTEDINNVLGLLKVS